MKRILQGTAAIVGAILLSAAAIGLDRAVSTPNYRPSPANFALLHKAEKDGGRNCRLEWNEAQGDHEVICDPAQGTADYNDGWNDAILDIRDQTRRPAQTWTNPDGSKGYSPNGMALIRECLSDTALSVEELGSCIDAPMN